MNRKGKYILSLLMFDFVNLCVPVLLWVHHVLLHTCMSSKALYAFFQESTSKMPRDFPLQPYVVGGKPPSLCLFGMEACLPQREKAVSPLVNPILWTDPTHGPKKHGFLLSYIGQVRSVLLRLTHLQMTFTMLLMHFNNHFFDHAYFYTNCAPRLP